MLRVEREREGEWGSEVESGLVKLDSELRDQYSLSKTKFNSKDHMNYLNSVEYIYMQVVGYALYIMRYI